MLYNKSKTKYSVNGPSGKLSFGKGDGTFYHHCGDGPNLQLESNRFSFSFFCSLNNNYYFFNIFIKKKNCESNERNAQGADKEFSDSR
jgi:hypothetical protein